MSDGWETRLIHPTRHAPEGFRSLVPGVFRASTTLYETVADAQDAERRGKPYEYGLSGTPTTLELAARIAELEGAHHTVIAPGGLAAILLVNLAFLGAGDHVLFPDSVYGPSRALANDVLRRFGVEVAYYDALCGAGIAHYLRDRTRLVWCESPGSIGMEVQDVPAIVTVAHAAGVVVALDKSYASGVLFDAFAHGVDVSIQALSKYAGGHSDLLLGSVSVRDAEHQERVARTHRVLGMGVSPDECSLALRGMQTLAVRLAHVERATLTVARHLVGKPHVERVLHPALASCPGHETWKRDFRGSASPFSFVFDAGISRERVNAFVERLRYFKIGASWGGVTSLAMAYRHIVRGERDYGDRTVRLNVGLERAQDLIADLDASLASLSSVVSDT